jgi:hypothetical protein
LKILAEFRASESETRTAIEKIDKVYLTPMRAAAELKNSPAKWLRLFLSRARQLVVDDAGKSVKRLSVG